MYGSRPRRSAVGVGAGTVAVFAAGIGAVAEKEVRGTACAAEFGLIGVNVIVLRLLAGSSLRRTFMGSALVFTMAPDQRGVYLPLFPVNVHF